MITPTIQWYPGHIAKAEKALLEQLKLVDVVFEVRDARIPLATHHPKLQSWLERPGTKTGRVLVLNRVDSIPGPVRQNWEQWMRSQGETPYFTDARQGQGVKSIAHAAQDVAAWVNERRLQRGMRPRPVRAAVIGFPNVGKSALINRLVKRRVVESAAKPGVTRQLRWVRISSELELLDAPGILPANLVDQSAAVKLAICDDIGQAAYDNQKVAAALVDLLCGLNLDPQPTLETPADISPKTSPKTSPETSLETLPESLTETSTAPPTATARSTGDRALEKRYGLAPGLLNGEDYVPALAEFRYQGDRERAARTLLQDFRKGALGNLPLELPPS
ncbi:GTPase [Limnothrix sp. PR1529]|uniref:ribosome biogenesis GTPase YlqF n=1 Tax=Limnothrix sp. PR1529 TaxID=1704291 RepID=UPI000B209A46|nr:ribosome biogenesis GTPase YlqF [Limnothrix sp. PR1529]PIB11646.1 GTPase [Limnothrix sp. PR1529]